MRYRFASIFTYISLFLLGSACRDCPSYPTYYLCQEQFEWLKGEGEVWKFVDSNGDTTIIRLGTASLGISATQGPPYPYFTQCKDSPKVQFLEQQLIFVQNPASIPNTKFNLKVENVSGQFVCTQAQYSIDFFHVYGKAKKHLDSTSVNGQFYKNVVQGYREYNTDSSNTNVPDTVYYSKEKGLLKLQFVHKNLTLERI